MIFIDKVLFFKLIDFVTLSVCQEGGGGGPGGSPYLEGGRPRGGDNFT